MSNGTGFEPRTSWTWPETWHVITTRNFPIVFEDLTLNDFSPQTGSVCSLTLLPAMRSSSQRPPAKKPTPPAERELPHTEASLTNSSRSPLSTLSFHSFLFPVFLPQPSYKLLWCQNWSIQSPARGLCKYTGSQTWFSSPTWMQPGLGTHAIFRWLQSLRSLSSYWPDCLLVTPSTRPAWPLPAHSGSPIPVSHDSPPAMLGWIHVSLSVLSLGGPRDIRCLEI